jgi:Carboxymuconolactone decarboxylase family
VNEEERYADTINNCKTAARETSRDLAGIQQSGWGVPYGRTTGRENSQVSQVAIAVGAGTEGGTHSAVRHAIEAGVTAQELEHVVLLSITTIGFPAAGRAFTWIHDKAY